MDRLVVGVACRPNGVPKSLHAKAFNTGTRVGAQKESLNGCVRLDADVAATWDKLWASGVSNPLVEIEQISYIIFLRRLEHLDDKEKAAAKREGKRHRSIFARHKGC